MKNEIEVLKFGGTSVGTPSAIKQTSEIVSALDTRAVIVVSAFCGVTDKLSEICRLLTNQRYDKAIKLSNEIFELHSEYSISMGVVQCIPFLKEILDYQLHLVSAVKTLNEISDKTKDSILSCGELMSSKIIAEYYNSIIGNTVWLDSREIIKTNSEYTNAEVDYDKSKALCDNVISELFSKDTKYIVCGGFIGSDSDGFTTTIGRGGSDHTAAIIAMGINANILKIYTDVTGIKTTDPRLIPTARTIKSLSYDEAFELAESGAKVLHPKTILPALKAGIAVHVLNTNEPDAGGTVITTNLSQTGFASAIAVKNTLINISLIPQKTNSGILKRAIELIDNYNIEMEALSYTKNSLSITLQKNLFVNELIEEFERFGELIVSDSATALTIVGCYIWSGNGLIAEIFALLDKHHTNVINHYISKNSIKLLVPTESSLSTLELLHNEIILKNVNFE
ncbi:MAG: aspartate kinase [bacterium]